MALRVALVGGPMYDALYALLPEDAEVVVHADHPTLNRIVAEMLGAGARIDVLSTHSKYAPSQAQWLRPLEAELASGLATRAVEMCSFAGGLLCVPRNVDVRVLWARRDRLPDPPSTWAELLASPAVFGFTGRESGLFGTVFEHVASHGGALFDDAGRPTLDTPLCTDAVAALCALAARAPAQLPTWHYDDVDAALARGEVDMAATWPGGFDALRRVRRRTRISCRSPTCQGREGSARTRDATRGRSLRHVEMCPPRSISYGASPRSMRTHSTCAADRCARMSRPLHRWSRWTPWTPAASTSSAARSTTG